MRLLLSNDDGIHAPGLAALEEALQDIGEVWVVAPASEQSAKSHAFTLHAPLRVRQHGERRFAVSGTPADSVYVGLHGVLDTAPDLVVSGINRGGNLGSDVFYSGTVAAAREGVLSGIPAIALSLHTQAVDEGYHWGTAKTVAARVVREVIGRGLPTGTLLNVNVPNVRPDTLRGIRATSLGTRVYEKAVAERRDPSGRPYFWIGGAHKHFVPRDGTDGVGTESGWATVTPLTTDPTHHACLDEIRGWTDG